MNRRRANCPTCPQCIRLLICGLLFAPAFAPVGALAAAPATQPASVIEGSLSAAGDAALSEVVVYLESPDPARVIAPSTQPTVKISQKEAQFQPRLTIITAGQTVEFPNDETRSIEHNVFSNSSTKRFDLGLYGPGTAKSITFDQPGAVYLYCSIHRHMDGVIFVSPTPYAVWIGENGQFRIENVPAGDWTIKTWQRRRRFPELSVPVKVEPSRPASVKLVLQRNS